jgi:hypothetical protein
MQTPCGFEEVLQSASRDGQQFLLFSTETETIPRFALLVERYFKFCLEKDWAQSRVAVAAATNAKKKRRLHRQGGSD